MPKCILTHLCIEANTLVKLTILKNFKNIIKQRDIRKLIIYISLRIKTSYHSLPYLGNLGCHFKVGSFGGGSCLNDLIVGGAGWNMGLMVDSGLANSSFLGSADLLLLGSRHTIFFKGNLLNIMLIH